MAEERGRVEERCAQACGFVSRIMVNREGGGATWQVSHVYLALRHQIDVPSFTCSWRSVASIAFIVRTSRLPGRPSPCTVDWCSRRNGTCERHFGSRSLFP